MLLLALLGGSVFKGRSGWCGTFCPLAPIQRTYGQAPLIVVRNGYCDPCVGCQKSCYDFNPRAAVFSDVCDEDPRHAAQRRLFMGLVPGLILGYFVQGPAPDHGTATYLAILLGACCASAGACGLAVAFAPASPYRVALAFGALALRAFHWFAGPIVVRTFAQLAGRRPPSLALQLSQGVGFVLAAALAASGLFAEARFKATQRKAAAAPPPDADGKTQFHGAASLKQGLARSNTADVTDRQSGISFPVAEDATLLEAIEGAGLKISFGCRAGVCGADPVAVCVGAEHLSPPGEEELATLRRLGLDGRARLACMCNVRGPVLIDRDPHSASAPPQVVPAARAPAVDKALRAGVRRVVVVGNGVAGTGVAEALRRQSDSVDIEFVGNEPYAFYNRMGIGGLVFDRAGLEGLLLVPLDWPAKQRVSVRCGAVAARIDRAAKRVQLAGGEQLPYDKLVLATGARSTPPDGEIFKHRNTFVMRSAEDAQAIRYCVGRAKARHAVVVGGGVLGVEAADALHHLGLKVTLLQRAVLAHGPRVRGDIFVAALGIQANTFIAEQAGLALGDNGIRVDFLTRSSDPDILAVGDVAELKGTPRGLWTIAAAHAATAAATILGEDLPYATPRIVLQLKCEGIDLRSQGEIVAREGEEQFQARADDPAWWRLVVRHGQLAGGLYVGPPGLLGAWAAEGKSLTTRQPPDR